MKDLAPEIVRQRLLIEGLFSREVDQAAVESYTRGSSSERKLSSSTLPRTWDSVRTAGRSFTPRAARVHPGTRASTRSSR